MEEGRKTEDDDCGTQSAVFVPRHRQIAVTQSEAMDGNVPGLPEIGNRFCVPEISELLNLLQIESASFAPLQKGGSA